MLTAAFMPILFVNDSIPIADYQYGACIMKPSLARSQATKGRYVSQDDTIEDDTSSVSSI